MRAEARRTARPDNREDLQELGAELIARLGWEEFCRRTLARAGLDRDSATCIVEGVRHLDALDALRDFFDPFLVYLVHLELGDEERDRRLTAIGVDPERGGAWEQHSTERDVPEALPARADLRVPVEQTLGASVAAIIDWLEAT